MAEHSARAPRHGSGRQTPSAPRTDPRVEPHAQQGHAAIRDQPLLEDELFHLEVTHELALQLEKLHSLISRIDQRGDDAAAECRLCAEDLRGMGLPHGIALRCDHGTV